MIDARVSHSGRRDSTLFLVTHHHHHQLDSKHRADMASAGIGTGAGVRVGALTPDEQETLIKTRMAVDERGIRRLVKKFAQIHAHAGPAGQPVAEAEEEAAARLSFQLELDQLRLSLSRLDSIAHATTGLQRDAYTAELASIRASQAAAHATIRHLKQQLRNVQRERSNKLSYDAIASEISSFPTRHQLRLSLDRLSQTLHTLRAERAKYTETSTAAVTRITQARIALEQLQADIGVEIGERERRQVERADVDEQDAEDTATATATGTGTQTPAEPAAAAATATATATAPDTQLNPAAAEFRPGDRQKQQDDEEGAWEETQTPPPPQSESESLARSKRARPDEDSEEEEGSIQQQPAATRRR